MKPKEEIVDIEELATKAASLDIPSLVEEILAREFIAGAQQDNVGVLYVKKDFLTPDFASDIMAVAQSWVAKKDKLQELYQAAASQFKQEVKFDLTQFPDEQIKGTVEQILANIQVRPAPDEMPEKYRLFSYKEISTIAKDNMIANFQQKTNLQEFLYRQGVSPDYRPTIESVEQALLTAYFIKALEGDPASKLVLPGQSQLFRP